MNATIANQDAMAGFSARTGSANFVRMFKPQFAALVEHGAKLQTVRPTPKRLPKPGDMMSARTWTGLPYRSKQRVLREVQITKVLPIEILGSHGIKLDGQLLTLGQEWDFARADGFNTPKDMFEWFAFEHGLPFAGVVLYWHNDRISDRADNAGGA